MLSNPRIWALGFEKLVIYLWRSSKAYWAIKACNMNYDKTGEQRKLQMQELDEISLEAYENSKFYKERTKRLHDHFITSKELVAGQRVLMFNSRLKLMPGKLRSRWIGPFFITHVHPHGVVELQSLTSTKIFKVNGHCLKLFHEIPQEETVEEITL
ncbi:uncharacterized protein [Phaseolus vulgaris]|uniref:uncharacterized protein n=1 Tax=Phaseolus vulgaris TaxID=3885 RepID=UPI0035CA2295